MIYLGIDGGGSKTAFLLEDETGKELGHFETGPSNWISAGEDEARKNIAAGIQQLKISPDVVCGGFAGAGRPAGIRFYTDCITGLLPRAKVLVETDAFISYVGAIGLEPGVLVIAGTGSIAIGRQQDGTMIRVGGWGPEFSDEGSGYWIGREAIRSALWANDVGETPEFVLSVCETLHLNTITDVSRAWKSGALTVSSVASLAALLFKLFPTYPAQPILLEAAMHLRTLTQTAIAQVGIPDCRRSIAGSIGRHPIMQLILPGMMEKADGIVFQDPLHSPERGAIIWGRSQARR